MRVLLVIAMVLGFVVAPAVAQTAPTVSALIISMKALDNGKVEIVVSAGKDLGVAPGWTGTVVDDQGKPVPGGSFTVGEVRRRSSKGLVTLTIAELTANKYQVELAP